mgnify:FL=1
MFNFKWNKLNLVRKLNMVEKLDKLFIKHFDCYVRGTTWGNYGGSKLVSNAFETPEELVLLKIDKPNLANLGTTMMSSVNCVKLAPPLIVKRAPRPIVSFISRFYISYEQAVRMTNDKTGDVFRNEIKDLVKLAKAVAERVFRDNGSPEPYQVDYEYILYPYRPGVVLGKQAFLELANDAGYEIRFFTKVFLNAK